METKLVKLNLTADWETAYDEELRAAATLLADGELVAFPTETVYGLGGNALLTSSAEKIYAAKGRPSDNPLIVHVATIEQAAAVAHLDERSHRLMTALCPAPLTLVLPKRECIPAAVTGGLDTVAVRIPNHPVALALLRACSVPVAAPSANLSGKPSPTTGEHVYNDLDGRIAMVLDSGSAGVGLESTVLDMTAETPVILRPGAVTAELLTPYLGEVLAGGVRVGETETPKAPGMKYRHYAPQGAVSLLPPDELAAEYRRRNDPKVMVLATAETLAAIKPPRRFVLGRDRDDLAGIAHNVFAGLRYCDLIGAEDILIEAFPEQGLGVAIMNRLQKAAAKV